MSEDLLATHTPAESLRMLAEQSGKTPLAGITWFEPTDAFWVGLTSVVPAGVRIIDVGTGMGHVPKAARERGYSMEGVDLNLRVGQEPDVLIMDANQISWSKDVWPLFCRPCHGNFVSSLANKALSQGANVLYAGLPKNMRPDLKKTGSKVRSKVGKEGETLYILTSSHVTHSKVL